MHSFSVSKSISATSASTTTTTTTSTSTSTTTSQDSHLGTADRQHPQGSFMGLSTTAHTPESLLIPATYHQQDELGLLSEIGTTQTNPFEALATHQTATFNDHHQEQSASSLSLSNEPSRSKRSSQPVEDVAHIVSKEQYPDPTDKWIVMTGNKKRPFRCGYEGCDRKYIRKASLKTHFVTHTGDSKLRCYLGECAGTVIYRDTRALTRHIHAHHSFERMFECRICHKRFRFQHNLKYHRDHLHFKKSKSSSAASTTHTANKSTKTSKVSQPELAAGQRQQGSYVGLSTTLHTPESTHIPASYPQDELRFLSAEDLRLLSDKDVSETSTPHINPFEALATHQIITFEDQDLAQEQPDEFPLPFDELLQPVDNVDPMAKEDPDEVSLFILPSLNDHIQQVLLGIVPEAVATGIAGVPNLPSDQYQAKQNPDPINTNEWIIVDKSQERAYKCGYQGCDKSYFSKPHLKRHFVKHTGKSKFKCPHPKCVRNKCFGDITLLKRHIASKHSLEKPFQCARCNKRFTRKEGLKYHREHVHSPENEQKSPKRKKK